MLGGRLNSVWGFSFRTFCMGILLSDPGTLKTNVDMECVTDTVLVMF